MKNMCRKILAQLLEGGAAAQVRLQGAPPMLKTSTAKTNAYEERTLHNYKKLEVLLHKQLFSLVSRTTLQHLLS